MSNQIIPPKQQAYAVADVSREAAETYIRAVQRRMTDDRGGCLASLDDMFCSGRPVSGLAGRYAGEMVAVSIAPILTPLIERIQGQRRPWLGKAFNYDEARGENILAASARPSLRLTHPFYRDIYPDTATTLRALRFRTYTAPALFDPELTVLKIDYDLPPNPTLTIRRVLDELVEVAGGYYLGRAWVRWWWGKWQRVAYFSLRPDRE